MNVTDPVNPAVPVSHYNGAVLRFPPIEVSSGSKPQIQLLTCVMVAENPLRLMVPSLYCQDKYRLEFILRHGKPECRTDSLFVVKFSLRVRGGVDGPGDQLIKLCLVREDGGPGSVVLLALVQTLDAIRRSSFKHDTSLMGSKN